jgi:hypothetical protein
MGTLVSGQCSAKVCTIIDGLDRAGAVALLINLLPGSAGEAPGPVQVPFVMDPVFWTSG